MDLGLSSYQLGDVGRGFGFRAGGRLDMRFDTSRGRPAADLLATLDAVRADGAVSQVRRGALRRANLPGDRGGAEQGARSRRPSNSRRWWSGPCRQARAPADPSRHARLPGAPNRRQRRARGAGGRPRRLARPAPAGRPPRGPELPLPGGPHRQALHRGRAAGLRLPARGSDLRLRSPATPSISRQVAHARRRRNPIQPALPQRASPGRGASGRMSAELEGGSPMSKRHQSSRRRSYGRRQHELHERTDRLVGVIDWLGESDSSQAEQRWSGRAGGSAARPGTGCSFRGSTRWLSTKAPGRAPRSFRAGAWRPPSSAPRRRRFRAVGHAWPCAPTGVHAPWASSSARSSLPSC